MTSLTSALRFTMTTGAIAALLWSGFGQRAIAANPQPTTDTPQAARPQPDALPTDLPGIGQLPDDIAQLLYPPVSNERQGLMVVGQGIVNAPADIAEIELTIYSANPYDYDYGYDWSEDYEEPASVPLPENPMTTATAQALVNAIIAAGAPATAVEYEIMQPDVYSYSTDDYLIITIDLPEPTQDSVASIVDAASARVDANGYYLDGTYVNYQINDCRPLIQQAYTAAIADAAARAESMAAALNVEIEPVPSVAESPFNLVYPPCDSEGNLDDSDIWGYNYWSGGFYDADAPATIRLQRDIFVTFPIRD